MFLKKVLPLIHRHFVNFAKCLYLCLCLCPLSKCPLSRARNFFLKIFGFFEIFRKIFQLPERRKFFQTGDFFDSFWKMGKMFPIWKIFPKYFEKIFQHLEKKFSAGWRKIISPCSRAISQKFLTSPRAILSFQTRHYLFSHSPETCCYVTYTQCARSAK